MPSHSLVDWTGRRADRLDRLVDAHRAVGGAGPGRRWLTAELNHALIVRLASEFQGYCRDLHDEATDVLIDQRFPGDAAMAAIVHTALVRDRRLNRGNASWANIVADFGGSNSACAMRSVPDGPSVTAPGSRRWTGSTTPATPSRTTTRWGSHGASRHSV